MEGNQGREETRLYTGRGLYKFLDSPCVWRSVWDSNPRHDLLSRTTVFKTAPFIHSGNAPDMDTVRRRENTVSTYVYHRKSRVVAATLVCSPCRYLGLPCRIRTCDPLLPKQMRYQTAPMVEVAPQVGLEPTARELTVRCSAIELLWNGAP